MEQKKILIIFAILMTFPIILSAIDPQATKHFNQGNFFYQEKYYEKAIEEYSKAIAIDRNDLDAFNNRGITYYHLGLYDLAIKDFSFVLDNRSDIFTYQSRAITYNTIGRYKKAHEDYRTVIQLNPDFFYSYFGLLYTSYYLSKKDFKKNYFYLLDQSSRIQEKNPWLYQIIRYLKKEIKYKELIQLTNGEQSRLNDAYFTIGFNYLRKKRKRKAKYFFQQCRQIALSDSPEYFLAKLELEKLK
ncbi:MAG: tetratricopeptide repeat protein [Spirochaetes bacterium]|nr:tetratricopeptide repeat protein [Spirochaetota bacterium]